MWILPTASTIMVLTIGEGKGSNGLRAVKSDMAMEIGDGGDAGITTGSSIVVLVYVLSTIPHFSGT